MAARARCSYSFPTRFPWWTARYISMERDAAGDGGAEAGTKLSTATAVKAQYEK